MSIGEPLRRLSRQEHLDRVLVSVRFENQTVPLSTNQLYQNRSASKFLTVGHFTILLIANCGTLFKRHILDPVKRLMDSDTSSGDDEFELLNPRQKLGECNFREGFIGAVELYPRERTNYLPGRNHMIYRVAAPFSHFLVSHAGAGPYEDGLRDFERQFEATFGRAAEESSRFSQTEDETYMSHEADTDTAIVRFGYGIYAPTREESQNASIEFLSSVGPSQDIREPSEDAKWQTPTLGETHRSVPACFYDGQLGVVVGRDSRAAPATIPDAPLDYPNAADRDFVFYAGRFSQKDKYFSVYALLAPPRKGKWQGRTLSCETTLHYIGDDGNPRYYSKERVFHRDALSRGHMDDEIAEMDTRIRSGKPLLVEATHPLGKVKKWFWIRFRDDVRELPLRRCPTTTRQTPSDGATALTLHPRPGDFVLRAIYLPKPGSYPLMTNQDRACSFSEVWLDLDEQGAPVTSPLQTRAYAARWRGGFLRYLKQVSPEFYDYASLRKLGSVRNHPLSAIDFHERDGAETENHWGNRVGFDGNRTAIFVETSKIEATGNPRTIAFMSSAGPAGSLRFDWIENYSGARTGDVSGSSVLPWFSEIYGNEAVEITPLKNGHFSLKQNRGAGNSGRPVLARVLDGDTLKVALQKDNLFKVAPGDRFILGPYEFQVAAGETGAT